LASLIHELMNVLKEETNCYETLLEIGDNKRNVIIEGDVPSLQDITAKEQELAGHISRLEKKRQEVINDICQVTNNKPQEMTIQKLINVLNEPERSELKKIQQKLIEVVETFKSINDINKKLIQQSLELLDFTMNAVRGINSKPILNNYEAKDNNYNSLGRNFFDAKQ